MVELKSDDDDPRHSILITCLAQAITPARENDFVDARNSTLNKPHILKTMNDSDMPASKGGDSNPDPITGEPGAHPIGTGVGAAGAGAAGAAIGAVAGPVGIVIGATVGAVAGGLAGKSVAESIDPTNEDGHWQQNHSHQVYGNHGSFERYKTAYRTGYEGVGRHGLDKSYSDVESDLKATYEGAKEKTDVTWDHAKHAARAAFERARNGLKKD